MLLLVILASTAVPNSETLQRCVDAVHAVSPAADNLCAVPSSSVDLFSGEQPDWARCTDAMGAGRRVAKASGLPKVMRDGLVRDFDKRIAACTTTAPAQDTPVRPTTNLWD
ncbi:hypothetical protein [Sphingomonas aracearum]|uniref:hypothetical protein n=1 Tax=Sphingomonas aracearum TaxID=2283317 RepID=UPI0011C075D0|nr:hypothetical protein [Sphingomonas aracearum]